MNIGIIGAGMVARAFATVAVARGHAIMLSNSRGPESLFTLVRVIGCKAGTPDEAAGFGDLTIVAVPLKHYRNVPVAPLSGKVVVDANNYYPERDGNIPALDTKSTTTSELLAVHLPHAHIVKAFNAIIATELERDALPRSAAGRRALPIAGDDLTAKARLVDLHDEIGYDVVDAGPLSEGWRFEEGRPAYCVPMSADVLRNTLAKTLR